MKIGKIYFLFAFILFIQLQVSAQSNINFYGSIKDKIGSGIAKANISFLDNVTDKVLARTIGTSEGGFELSLTTDGPVKLLISVIGYRNYSRDVVWSKDVQKVDLGTIILDSISYQMQDVVINAKKPIIQLLPDKTIFLVEGTIAAVGSCALDILNRAPGVFIDNNGNIQLQGKVGVNVMIDGRPLYMNAMELNNYLKTKSADNIKQIEITSNPTARFDAEGAGGVIDIRLKKHHTDGLLLSMQGGGQYNGSIGYNGNSTINYKMRKWSTGLNANYNKARNMTDFETNRQLGHWDAETNFSQYAVINGKTESILLNAMVDYDINLNNLLGINSQYTKLNSNNYSTSQSYIVGSPNEESSLLSINNGQGSNNRIAANIHYIGKLDTIGSQLTADVDFANADFVNVSLLMNEYSNQENDQITTNNPALYTVFTIKSDYKKSIGKNIIEMGLKSSWVRADNEIQVDNFSKTQWIRDNNLSNHFLYEERIQAAYVNYKRSLNKLIKLEVGLIAEHTHVSGNSVTSAIENKMNYLDLFPTAMLTQTINKKYQIAYNYNRRITRPSYRLLNPFTFYVDPYTLQTGNPYLMPMYAHNFEINNIFKNRYQLAFGYTATKQVFSQVFNQDDETALTIIQIQNLDRQHNLNARITAVVGFSKGWNSNQMLLLNFTQFKTHLNGGDLNNRILSYVFRTQHQVSLPKQINLELLGIFRGPSSNGQLQLRAMYWFDIGLQKMFFQNKMGLSINATDLLRSQKTRGNIYFGNINSDIYQYNGARGIKFTLTYKVNKGKTFSLQKRSGSIEEQQRIN